MRIAIVTNMNGIGLQRDFELLSDFLGNMGNEVIGYQFDNIPQPNENQLQHDLAIFLEVVPRHWLDLAPLRWAFLNPEWCKPDVIKAVDRHIHKVFAKTHYGYEVLKKEFGDKVHYVGFLARDIFNPKIERRPWYLHLGGNSLMRGAEVCIDAWKWVKRGKFMDRHLIVVSSALPWVNDAHMVSHYERLDDEQLKSLMNQCRYHLYPTGTEGFGHAIHESLSCGAALILTDAPPMNEILNSYKLAAMKVGNYNLADIYEVSALTVHNKVLEMEKLVDVNWDAQMEASREEFINGNCTFAEKFIPHVAEHAASLLPQTIEIRTPARRSLKNSREIAFIGNFAARESTENMIKWALEEALGYDVVPLQENEVNLGAIRTACETCDALIWVRTPGWLNAPEAYMREFLEKLKIPSISIHLDKFWGIPEREELIGRHPFWLTKHVWTADGSEWQRFKDRGVNHHWMRPAVSEVYCHPGTPREGYRCDVGFVGARDYHLEYAFRPMMVDWLGEKYKNNFKHITNIRGHELNDFYASCKVVVGDCIFAGTNYYWSDRVPETVGRYGLLLHPAITGLMVPVPFYQAQNIFSLEESIDALLVVPEKTRRDMRNEGALHVRTYDTWTVRMKEILEASL